jgi:hypothetical protein
MIFNSFVKIVTMFFIVCVKFWAYFWKSWKLVMGLIKINKHSVADGSMMKLLTFWNMKKIYK